MSARCPDRPQKRPCSGIPERQVRARKRHMHRSKQRHYSITSSARASKIGGISMPSDLPVTRLMSSSNLVGCSTGEVSRLRSARELVAPGRAVAKRLELCPTKYLSVGRRFWKLQAPSKLLLSRSQQYGQRGTGHYP